jgi:hypothetical protein
LDMVDLTKQALLHSFGHRTSYRYVPTTWGKGTGITLWRSPYSTVDITHLTLTTTITWLLHNRIHPIYHRLRLLWTTVTWIIWHEYVLLFLLLITAKVIFSRRLTWSSPMPKRGLRRHKSSACRHGWMINHKWEKWDYIRKLSIRNSENYKWTLHFMWNLWFHMNSKLNHLNIRENTSISLLIPLYQNQTHANI